MWAGHHAVALSLTAESVAARAERTSNQVHATPRCWTATGFDEWGVPQVLHNLQMAQDSTCPSLPAKSSLSDSLLRALTHTKVSANMISGSDSLWAGKG